MHADDVDPTVVGAQWLERMGFTNDRALAVRARWGDDPGRVTDVHFDQAVTDPVAQVARIHEAIGVELTTEAESAMRRWLAQLPRESTTRPAYGAADFGLSDECIDERFAAYNARFRSI